MRRMLLTALFALPALAEGPRTQPYLLWVKGSNSAARFIRNSISIRKPAYQHAYCNGESDVALAADKEHADAIVSAEVDLRLSSGKTVTVIVLDRRGRILKALGPSTHEDVSGQLFQWACCCRPER